MSDPIDANITSLQGVHDMVRAVAAALKQARAAAPTVAYTVASSGNVHTAVLTMPGECSFLIEIVGNLATVSATVAGNRCKPETIVLDADPVGRPA